MLPGLPLDVADLTADWFAATLGREVSAVEVLETSSGTTGRARVALTGDPALPPSVFVKLAPFDARQRDFVTSVGMGVSEARFYRDLAPEIPVRIPAVWFSATDGDGYVMVLEDLVAAGCRFPHPKDDDIAARARDIVEQMAALHARFWESPRFEDDGDLAWLAPKGTGAAGGGATFVKMAVDALGSQLPEEFHRLADIYLARNDDIVALWNSGPRTLVHGDPHLGNLYVDGHLDESLGRGNGTGFLDWAMIGRSPGLRDVAYTLCNSIPAAVRAADERALLARYCEILGESGITLDLDTAWDQYRLFAVYSWVSAASTAGMGSKWQPLHIGLGGTKRATAACAALGCVDLLEHLLA
ncbi:MAG TPA: aminoglycoside phosphotransferase family protein [Acidimicrobiia bacterium]|nr:aminoglycoside phosphotransferase family protein [Acidimicrobiia bacterium]